jgi:sortase B
MMDMDQKDRKQNTGRGRKGFLIVIVMIVLLLVLAGCGRALLNGWFIRKSADDTYDRLADDSNVGQAEEETEEEEEETEITAPEKALDWDALHAENEDIYAWIYIPNTQVDYPILQHPTEPDYYLDYNLDGSKGYPGCIYSQYYNEKDFRDPNTILYGHNMKNGTMFGSLHNFEDREFFDENPYIYIYTEDETLVYEIFAAGSIGDEHLMYKYDFWNEDDFESFVSDIRSGEGVTSLVREDVEVVDGDELLTLSTCIADQPEQRWVVVGKLLNPTE